MRVWKLTVLVGVFSVVVSGCGNDCVDSCEAQKECNQIGGPDASTDCVSVCETAAKEAEENGCKSQRDDYVACFANVDDICQFNTSSECKAEDLVLETCEG